MYNLGFDAKRAFGNKSGLGNYARNLLSAFIDQYPDYDYFLFNPEKGRFKLSDFLQKASNIHLVEPQHYFHRTFPSYWRSYGITEDIKKLQLHLYHGLSNEIPLNLHKANLLKLVTIHDLIFIRHPEYYTKTDRKIYTLKTEKSCKIADHIVAVSHQTKYDLMELMGIPENKISVVYQSCDSNFFNEHHAFEHIDSPEKNLPEEYILYVGTIEQRKNLFGLVKAIHQLDKSMKVNLVVVGKSTPYATEVKDYIYKYNLHKRITFMQSVNNTLLPYIYRKAKAFIYPSLYEGFGIPIIEALASKIPVITTKGGCFVESAGPDSVFINPDSAEEIAAAIEMVLTNTDKREMMVNQGYQYVQQFKPAVCAQNMHALYQSLL